MRDKLLMTTLTVVFFLGAMLSLRFSNHDLFAFSSGLCSIAFGAVVALVRGSDKQTPTFPVSDDQPKQS
jgi:hypothetical protein